MKKLPFLLLILLTACTSTEKQKMDRYINHLMRQMTIEEKLGQLNLPTSGEIVTGAAQSSNIAQQIREGKVGGLFNLKGVEAIREVQRIAVEESRLGIPLIFGLDVIHGYETVFPIPLALSCSWDMNAIQQSAQIAALEATADGLCWTFSPVVDICHDARWGRIAEGSGEDPYLGSLVAKAMVNGYQGDHLADSTTMMACVKHFALYGAPDGGIDYNTVDMSRYRMYNEYLPPYKAAVEAGAGTVMASFNTIDGIPATCNQWLLTDLLRTQWGFQGFVVSDYTGVEELMKHSVGDSLEQVSLMALQAGLDMDMVSEGHVNLAAAYQQGLISKRTIDAACRRILEAKYRLGLFDDPYRYCNLNRRQRDIYTPQNRQIARNIAHECMVLLKNDNQLLPLCPNQTIALIGPLADTRANMPGTWSVAAAFDRYKTLKEGIENAMNGQGRLLYAKGCNLMYDEAAERNATMFGREIRDTRSNEQMNAEALSIARQADVILLAMGEASEMSGECTSRVNLEMPDAQHDLLVKLSQLNKPIVLLHFSGRPSILNWETAHLPAILEVWSSGSEAGDAIADVVFGKAAPSGHLTVSLPRSVGQLPYSYRHFNSGRPNPDDHFNKFVVGYMDSPMSPLYPFGYGLTYTTFAYSDVTVSATNMTPQDTIIASVTVTNTGTRPGDEVVQLYIQDVVSTPVRPVQELRGFQRIHLQPGESQQVQFAITSDMLGFYDQFQTWTTPLGRYRIMLGANCNSVQSRELLFLSILS